MAEIVLTGAERVDGEVVVPGDKSISHRALILGALARGRSYIGNLSPAADVSSTAGCLEAAGATLHRPDAGRVALEGSGMGDSLRSPVAALDCGNSGTTMRLLAAALAGHDLSATLDGDASLRRRPMLRVAEPLRLMGAVVETAQGGTPPLTVTGHRRLAAIDYVMPVASAQVKSAILLAALAADGISSVVEPAATRDHTERLLRLCGVEVLAEGNRVSVVSGPLAPFGLTVPGDLSSAAFFLALAASRPGWTVRCPGVTLNPGRTGVLEVLAAMGADLSVEKGEPAAGVEPLGAVAVRGRSLRATTIAGDLIPRCIDELPVLALLATQAEGTTVIADAAELRLKESDRIATVAAGLSALGGRCEVHEDGMVIEGPCRLRATTLHSGGDHRLAMAWAVAACLADPASGATRITGIDAAAVSYPGFLADLRALVAGR